MASIDTGGAGARKGAVTGELPLVPFVDLLLCCVMFLLVTAVWNQLGALQAQSTGPSPTADVLPAPPAHQLLVEVHQDGYRISGDAGDAMDVPAVDGSLDRLALEQALTSYREVLGATPVMLMPDDDVNHGQIIETMDTLVGAGYSAISMGGGFGST